MRLGERLGRLGQNRNCQKEQPRGCSRGPVSNPDKTPPIHAFCVGRNRGNFKPPVADYRRGITLSP
jgi:hypothetical protein